MDVSSEDFDLLANRLTDIYSALDNIDNALLNRWDRDSLAKDIFTRICSDPANSSSSGEHFEPLARYAFTAADAFMKVLEAQE